MDALAKVTEKVERAKAAARLLARASSADKDRALARMADLLNAEAPYLLAANRDDVSAAGKAGLSRAALERLTLTPERIRALAEGIREIITLPDPVGEITHMRRRPNGMSVGRMRVPIGLVAVVYESLPALTVDAAALCLKAGNAVILRGGPEALHSNGAIVRVLAKAVAEAGLPAEALAFVDDPDRSLVTGMLKLDAYIDLVIPRGGDELVRAVTDASTIPVLKHDKAVCHVYVDASAELAMARAICVNAKLQAPAMGNAMETLLVHEGIAARLLPSLGEELQRAGVELRGCPRTMELLPGARAVSEQDWHTDYGDLVLNVRVVAGFDEAADHIATHGSGHTEAVVTSDYATARRFLKEIDAATVLVNASTRLADGYELGLGADLGVSTTRIHARGPMGLEELTSTKLVVTGDGQLRS